MITKKHHLKMTNERTDRSTDMKCLVAMKEQGRRRQKKRSIKTKSVAFFFHSYSFSFFVFPFLAKKKKDKSASSHDIDAAAFAAAAENTKESRKQQLRHERGRAADKDVTRD